MWTPWNSMDHHEHLKNIRHGNDLTIYSRSPPALVKTVNTLSCELQQVGTHLNAAKSEIFSKPLDHIVHAEVSQDLVHVLHGESSHGNFGRHIPKTWNMWPCGTTASHFKRVGIMQQTLDFTYKQTRALEIAIEVFQCSRRPCFFSLHALALTKVQFKKCRPIPTQNVTINWSEMMRRMNYRINVVLSDFLEFFFAAGTRS